ncbi:2Fe-2S iron-sulfur cluster-binding protein [Natrinema amylolyticum]|uniref:2Fe-2S iron-sulfur cluster-binding protein n=1 Tax=Natrinema amylolyticum TaxID=2878679 RepID=UPI00299E679E|nr:2Fe-2S iron-sulfur cluster-binding protein [Natrinema amylolyticum]
MTADDQATDTASATDGDWPVTSPGPAPSLTPEQVVRAQVESILGASETDAGGGSNESVSPALRTLFDFASPEFRTRHGSLETFAATLSGPMHDRLLAAESIERGPLEYEDGRVTLTVLARHPAGDRTYEFVLTEQSAGKYAECWMTDSIDLIYNGVSPSFRRMPTVTVGDRELKCDEGATLRDALLRADGYSPHNEMTQVANCGGNGLCGTCAVEVDGETDQLGSREQRRLSLPPHEESDGLRLSCQTCVRGDLEVTKHGGLWGQHVEDRTDVDEEPPEPITVTEAEYDGTFEYELEPGTSSETGGTSKSASTAGER